MRRALRFLCLVPLLCLALAACGGRSVAPGQDKPAPPPQEQPKSPPQEQPKSAPGSATAQAGDLPETAAPLRPAVGR